MLRIQMNLVVTLAVLLLAPAMIRAADVVDGGGFFSAETLAKANRTIRDLETKTGHEIRIETFATVPADKAETVKKMDKAERDTFFTKWLHSRAEDTKSRGVFVLICKEPAHLNLWGANAIQHSGFGASEAKSVREILLNGFKAKEYDKTLTAALVQLTTIFEGLKSNKQKGAVTTTHPTLKNHHTSQPTHQAPLSRSPVPAAPAPAPESSWGSVLVVVAMVIGGIFLFSMVMRMFSGGGQNYGPGGPGGVGVGVGGGGFLSGLTGGIFGALAGNWLFNQFSDHQASASETHSSGSDTSNSSGDNGGFDSGSADNGGTDFGGGDFGGDDFGGGDGGGDF